MKGMIRCSNSGIGKFFFTFLKGANRFWGPRRLLFNEYRKSFTGQSARGVILNTRIHLVSKLRMTGVIPPVSLHAFMDWKGTGLLYLSMCHVGLEMIKNRQLSICEKLIWSCLSSISTDRPEKQRKLSWRPITWPTFWRDSIATTKWPLFNILKAKRLPKM